MASKKKSSSQQALDLKGTATWFDRLPNVRKDLLCIGILYILVLFLFSKIIFDNMIFSDSGDTATAQSLAKAMEHLNTTEGKSPLWIPYIFSGMPVAGTLSFPRDLNYVEQLVQLVGRIFFLNADMFWFVLHYFLMGVFMYLLARELKFAPLPSLLAAITLMLNPYAIGEAQGGHGSRIITLSYIPLMFLLTHSLFERRNLLSMGLLAATFGTMLLSRHPQMAFYGMLLVGSFALYEVVSDARKLPSLVIKKALLFACALAIGAVIYTYEYLPTQQYATYSIRGGGGDAGGASGLTYDYATNWSLHPLETFTYIIPSFFGFSSQYVTDWQGQQAALPLYWGWMPFTDNPPYIGIIPLVLAIIAITYRRNRMTWFLLAVSILTFFISFGKHLSIVYDFFYYYVPYFNKFRAPSMILYLIPIAFGILAAAGMTFLIESNQTKEFDSLRFKKRVMTILYVMGGLLLVGFVAKGAIYGFLSDFMFSKQGEAQQYGPQVVKLFKEKRFDLLAADYAKISLYVGAFLALLVLFLGRKISQTLFAFGTIGLLVLDLVIIDGLFINPKPKTALDEQPEQVVQQLQAAANTSQFRIFAGGDLFQDNSFMYHHIEAIGGYSPAKLKIYQELIDSCFSKGNKNVFNMLNAKYLVGQQKGENGGGQTFAQLNQDYLPRAWFVDTAIVRATKAEVFAELNSPLWNPRHTAVLEKALAENVVRSDSSSVTITKKVSSEIAMDVYTTKTSLLVLSEIYYPAGWIAVIDGVETPIYKTNYVLRSVVVPAGKHVVEFRFEPHIYEVGLTFTQGAWILSLVLVVIGFVQSPAVMQRFGRKKVDSIAKEQSPDQALPT